MRPDGLAGLRRHRSHEIIDVGTCPIAHPLVNESGITQGRWPGAESVAAVTSPSTGERAVVVTPGARRAAAGPLAGLRAAAARARAADPGGRRSRTSGPPRWKTRSWWPPRAAG